MSEAQRKDKMVELELHIHRTDERQILASTDGNIWHAVSLYLAQIDVVRHRGSLPLAKVSMTEGLAHERGLI